MWRNDASRDLFSWFDPLPKPPYGGTKAFLPLGTKHVLGSHFPTNTDNYLVDA